MALGAWGGHQNGRIPLDAMVAVQGQELQPDVARRLEWAIAQCALQGIIYVLEEGYRPLGVPADANVPSIEPSGVPAAETSTSPYNRGSNQWFQRGRWKRGKTPSAAIPGTSNHGNGQAGDGRFEPADRRDEGVQIFAAAGLLFTIKGELWHWDSSGTPSQECLAALAEIPAPSPEEEENMSSILYQSNVPNAQVVYELDTVTKTTRIIGKTDGALGFLGAAPVQTGRKVYTINEDQLKKLLSFYPCEPVPAALYAEMKGNKPPILGLSKK